MRYRFDQEKKRVIDTVTGKKVVDIKDGCGVVVAGKLNGLDENIRTRDDEIKALRAMLKERSYRV